MRKNLKTLKVYISKTYNLVIFHCAIADLRRFIVIIVNYSLMDPGGEKNKCNSKLVRSI